MPPVTSASASDGRRIRKVKVVRRRNAKGRFVKKSTVKAQNLTVETMKEDESGSKEEHQVIVSHTSTFSEQLEDARKELAKVRENKEKMVKMLEDFKECITMIGVVRSIYRSHCIKILIHEDLIHYWHSVKDFLSTFQDQTEVSFPKINYRLKRFFEKIREESQPCVICMEIVYPMVQTRYKCSQCNKMFHSHVVIPSENQFYEMSTVPVRVVKGRKAGKPAPSDSEKLELAKIELARTRADREILLELLEQLQEYEFMKNTYYEGHCEDMVKYVILKDVSDFYLAVDNFLSELDGKADIISLPEIDARTKNLFDKFPEDAKQCVVCFEMVYQSAQNSYKCLQCCTYFHTPCWDQWEQYKNACPHCRFTG